MGVVELGILEKLMIIMHCKRDLRRERFEEFTYGYDSATKAKFFVSPFITTELAFFVARRSKILGKLYVTVNTTGKKTLLGFRFLRFPNAVCRIDELIAETEWSICGSTARYDDMIKDLLLQRERFLEHQALHHAQLCLDQIDTVRSEKQNKIQGLQKKLLVFVSEKVRIISIVNTKINLYKTRCILRIQYYYGYACAHSDKLPVMMYSQENLEAICGKKIDVEDTGELQKAQNKMADIIKSTSEEVVANEKTPV